MALAAYTTARTALRSYLLAALPGKMAALNALRAASITSRIQNFTIPASAVLKLSTQGAATSSVPLTAGTRTAAQIVTDITAVLAGIAATDSQGRVVITSATAPSGSPLTGTRSQVTLGADTTGANAALGWSVGGNTIIRAPVAAPLDMTFPTYEKRHRQFNADGGAPRFELLDFKGQTDGRGVKSRETEVRQAIRIMDTAATEDEVDERVVSLARACQDAIGDDRTLYGQAIFCDIASFQRLPALYTFGDLGVPIGVATLDVVVRMYDP